MIRRKCSDPSCDRHFSPSGRDQLQCVRPTLNCFRRESTIEGRQLSPLMHGEPQQKHIGSLRAR